MISKTHGIALRIDPFSKTSHIISWLTPDKGRISTLAKGAMRPRSAFLGQYDLFYTCELVYYPGTRSALGILKECSPVNHRDGMRTRWKSFLAASYFADVLHRIPETDAPNLSLYRFAGRMFDFLAKQDCSVNALYWAELKLLSMLGVGPRLLSCVACGSSSIPVSGPTSFSIPRGGLICDSCRVGAKDEIIPVNQDTLAMLRQWQQASTPLIAERTACSDHQNGMIDKILTNFMTYHVESSTSRSVALAML
jgi:DNA repair protein RecO (recombination protein O)